MRVTVACIILLSLLTAAPLAPANSESPRCKGTFAGLPLYFVENRGQAHEDVAYYVQGEDRTLFFTADGVTFDLPRRDLPGQGRSGPDRWAVKLDFVESNPEARPEGSGREKAAFSYFKGKPGDWMTDIPAFRRLVYRDLWPGIDLVYSGTVDRLKYEFMVRAGADPGKIRLAYHGVSELAVETDGALKVTTPAGSFTDGTPCAYQMVNGEPKTVSMDYAIEPAAADGVWSYGFRLGDYDPKASLILDPVLLVYCGFIGGSEEDEGKGVAVDEKGCVYVTGRTWSGQSTFPVKAGPYLNHSGFGTDAFLAKVNAKGTALVYCGYIGGSGGLFFEGGHDVTVDGQGNAYVIGATSSNQATFPVTVGPDLTYNGGDCDTFVAKINPQGTGLVFCGYVGGASWDDGVDIAVDSTNHVYITGITSSDASTFPDLNGPDLTYNGGQFDAFVVKINASGQFLDYCGYIGGDDSDSGLGIEVDSNGSAYVTGVTSSDETTFPVHVGPDLNYNGGHQDAFVAKVNSSGLSLDYCGYIGGDGSDLGWDVAVNATGSAYVTGHTQSAESTFPDLVGPDRFYNGGSDAFVARVAPAGTGLYYCGYIGGTGYDRGTGIALDSSGRAYVTGYTSSDESSFPVKLGPGLAYNGGATDAFVARVGDQGLSLEYCGFLGGADGDEAWDVAVDDGGRVYLTGKTLSTESTFPAAVGPDLTQNGTADAFVARIAVTPGTWFVDDDNVTGPWEGTSEHPFEFIQDGIDIALDHDTVRVLPGTYLENISFEGKAITVSSTGGSDQTVIDGGNPSNPFQGSVAKFTAGEGPDAVLEGFTLQNGYGSLIGAAPVYRGGGILCLSSSPTIRNNRFLKNSVSPGYGGAIYVGYGTPAIQGNLIAENSAGGSPCGGGGIHIFMDDDTSGTLLVENNDITTNDTGEYGGGVYVEGTDGNPNWPDLVVIENNTVSKNDSSGFAGGIYCHNYAKPTIRGNLISGNRAVLGAGGIGVTYYADPVIDGNIIVSNDGDWGGTGHPGGGIRLDNQCSAVIRNNFIAENTAAVGAGVHCWYVQYVFLTNNTITENVATYMGGGIGFYGAGSLSVANTIIWGNPAHTDKEVYLQGGTLKISYSDVKGGKGAVYVDSGAALSWGSGMLDADPVLTDPGSGDFHLTGGSPCIESGSNKALHLPDVDIDGDPRIFPGKGTAAAPAPSPWPWKAGVDMGADEYCLYKKKGTSSR